MNFIRNLLARRRQRQFIKFEIYKDKFERDFGSQIIARDLRSIKDLEETDESYAIDDSVQEIMIADSKTPYQRRWTRNGDVWQCERVDYRRKNFADFVGGDADEEHI
jgi:hypothetical protein